ncbi:hypothetical protein GY14_27765 [Delftia tsuruhatensis]|nr:hypothetical protein GY14_27765 [Delftia tsuruhatensis]
MSTAKTAWMARLGMRHPIIQAPMAGTSTPALAAAVTEAGGLGSLGIGASGTEQARQQIVQARALTSGAFNVNLFCHRPARADAQREAAWLAHLRPSSRASAPRRLPRSTRSTPPPSATPRCRPCCCRSGPPW